MQTEVNLSGFQNHLMDQQFNYTATKNPFQKVERTSWEIREMIRNQVGFTEDRKTVCCPMFSPLSVTVCKGRLSPLLSVLIITLQLGEKTRAQGLLWRWTDRTGSQSRDQEEGSGGSVGMCRWFPALSARSRKPIRRPIVLLLYEITRMEMGFQGVLSQINFYWDEKWEVESFRTAALRPQQISENTEIAFKYFVQTKWNN